MLDYLETSYPIATNENEILASARMTKTSIQHSSDLEAETSQRNTLTISQLNQLSKQLLEESFPAIWVSGEISNFVRPSSGHWYFTLKDAQAQVRSVMFRGRNQSIGFVPTDGHHVMVRGKLSLYTARGDYQLLIDHMEPAGDGLLRQKFEALKKQLAQEGLFSETHKKPLPAIPTQIGVITSPTGAVIRDILSVLSRRFPAIPVLIYPTLVQGSTAAGTIVEAIELANQQACCDVLILARGGGSLEDLWPFNEEIVARAIYTSHIPIVSAVGHEVDFTIADFVADLRAPTPSVAAETVSPDRKNLLLQLNETQKRLVHFMRVQLNHLKIQCETLNKRLPSPDRYVQTQIQRLDELNIRLERGVKAFLQQKHHKLLQISSQIKQLSPAQQLTKKRFQVEQWMLKLQKQMELNLKNYRHRLTTLVSTLDAVSPLATLSRGYAVTQTSDGKIVRDASECQVGQEIVTRLHQGRIKSKVSSIESDQ